MAGEQVNAVQPNNDFIEPQGSFDVNGCTLHVWLKNNHHLFWERSTNGGIRLGKRLTKVFRQIILQLKVYHDQNLGYGNLSNGIKMLENDEVVFCNKTNASVAGGELDVICRDMLDLKRLIEGAVKQFHLEEPVLLSKFYELYDDFSKYCGTIGSIRIFSFYVRNNPLFLDTTAIYLLIQKILDLRAYDCQYFDAAIKRYVRAELSDWHKLVRHKQLQSVLHYKNNKHMTLYSRNDGIAFFLRSCFGHAKDHDRTLDIGKITELILDDLPFVLPTLFLGMIRGVDNFASKVRLGRISLIDFLQKEPSVFF